MVGQIDRAKQEGRQNKLWAWGDTAGFSEYPQQQKELQLSV